MPISANPTYFIVLLAKSPPTAPAQWTVEHLILGFQPVLSGPRSGWWCAGYEGRTGPIRIYKEPVQYWERSRVKGVGGWVVEVGDVHSGLAAEKEKTGRERMNSHVI